MDKIKVEIAVVASRAWPNYDYESKVERSVSVEGFYPAIINTPFEYLCHSLAQDALSEFCDKLEEENNGED